MYIRVGLDSAESHGIEPMAELVAHGQVAGPDTSLLYQPSNAILLALEHARITVGDLDLFEINEAFAAVVLRFFKDTGVDWSKVNVNGGAMALGHPIGATGGMLIGTLLDELERQDKQIGLVTMCTGGGMGTATIIERI
mgnify:CR=1 FL=1